MVIDWNRILEAIIVAIPPTIMAWAALRKTVEVAKKAEHIEKLTNGNAAATQAKLTRVEDRLYDIQEKRIDEARQRRDEHGPSAGDSDRRT